MLDAVRYLIVWNPIIFMTLSLLLHIFGPRHHHHNHTASFTLESSPLPLPMPSPPMPQLASLGG